MSNSATDLRERREALVPRVSQEELAIRVGVRTRTISRWESGEGPATAAARRRWVDAIEKLEQEQ